MNPTCDVALTGRYNLRKSAAALGCSRNALIQYRKQFPDLLPVHYFITGEAFIYGRDLRKFHATEKKYGRG